MTAVAVKELPISFSTQMVRAILSGQKVQTRRVLKPQPPDWVDQVGFDAFCGERQAAGRGTHPEHGRAEKFLTARFWNGDRLWVRETYCYPDPTDKRTICYRASDDQVTTGEKWKSGRFMPRAAARLWIEVIAVRIERLQAISESDAIMEGCRPDTRDGTIIADFEATSARYEFRELWESINTNPDFSWSANPWVWVITFKRITR